MKQPNVLWIVMDAVRADTLSCYGYGRNTTRNIDKLSETGVLFEKAFSTSNWTPPSHASMFTGLYPSNHGVLQPDLTLSDRNITLAEILSGNGYETLLISPSPQITGYRNMNKGFTRTIESYRGKMNFRDPLLYPSLIRNLFYGWDKQTHYFNQIIKRESNNFREKGNSFFIFVNYATVHWPYTVPRNFNKFSLPSSADKKKVDELSGRESMLKKFIRGRKKNPADKYPYNFIAGAIDVSGDELSALKTLYDNEVYYLDHLLGGLFRFILEEDLMDDTIIILTADHGEMFGEHGLGTHWYCLYDVALRTPLIIHYPNGLKPGTVKHMVSLVDLFPTILALTEIDHRQPVDGFDMFSPDYMREHVLAEVGRPDEPLRKLEETFPDFDKSRFNKSLKCIRTDDYKYIIGSDGSEELYDLRKDPGELHNIIEEERDTAIQLKSALENEIQRSGREKVRHRIRNLKRSGRFRI